MCFQECACQGKNLSLFGFRLFFSHQQCLRTLCYCAPNASLNFKLQPHHICIANINLFLRYSNTLKHDISLQCPKTCFRTSPKIRQHLEKPDLGNKPLRVKISAQRRYLFVGNLLFFITRQGFSIFAVFLPPPLSSEISIEGLKDVTHLSSIESLFCEEKIAGKGQREGG